MKYTVVSCPLGTVFLDSASPDITIANIKTCLLYQSYINHTQSIRHNVRSDITTLSESDMNFIFRNELVLIFLV